MAINPPILLALVLCDGTIREAGTNKLSLIGTFNGVFAPNFPCTHPSLSVYVALTDGRGKVPCSLKMVSQADQRELFNLPGQVDFQDPTGVAELVFQLHQVSFDREGSYTFEFYAQGEMLGSRRLVVHDVRKNPPPGGNNPNRNN